MNKSAQVGKLALKPLCDDIAIAGDGGLLLGIHNSFHALNDGHLAKGAHQNINAVGSIYCD